MFGHSNAFNSLTHSLTHSLRKLSKVLYFFPEANSSFFIFDPDSENMSGGSL